MTNKAIIAGASGLIGSNLLTILLQQPVYDQVLILVRKELDIKHPKLKQLAVNFNKLNDYDIDINGHALFCCLGSTRKKTPDLSVYRKIDHDYPLHLAQIALKNGIEQYHLVSAIGADSGSANFYTKMKGETENDIKQVGLPCLFIYQPSLIRGARKERRFFEKIAMGAMKLIDPLLLASLKKYRSIPAETIALAMFKQSTKNEKGIFVYPSDKIKQLL